MEVLKEDLSLVEIGSSVEAFVKLLDSQKELFHSQIDQFQDIVVTQCRLTCVNPLSQEMAAGALSIKIGKRPRDLLNPKAVKYMQSVFSIKDAISKKESREISALFGVTVTQVRDFFTSQRSRVRKSVQLSREKATRSNASKEPQDGVPTSSDPLVPIDLVPLNTITPTNVEEAPSCSTDDQFLLSLDNSDKHFTENIFNMMRKEEIFSGQVKLMEWILRIENSAVLHWFSSNGGLMILATWLSQAAIEEQTSVLVVILKVLCHLPLHKALPLHMSAILQSVNRLRFYRTSDISNRARVLLSRWSKIFARSQAAKKHNGMKSCTNAQNDIILKQSIGEIMDDESWQSNIESDQMLVSQHERSENCRKLEPPQLLKLMPASADDLNKKNIRDTRGRRKVQLMEQPGQNIAGRSPPVARVVKVMPGRPMSADDIQKAKMRAQFMQSKYGKIGSLPSEGNEVQTESPNKSLTNIKEHKMPVHAQPIAEHKKPVTLPLKVSSPLESTMHSKLKMDSKEYILEMCKRVQVSWQTPPEMKLIDVWSVGAGENSKEVEVQRNRNNREKETVYHTIVEIPSNPKNPWDIDMDYDDTLTPLIPIEQLPDADGTETQVSNNEDLNRANMLAPTTSQIGGEHPAEPDLELLAVLLKNPELVFALTSGQAGNLSSEDTVKLLDMIKVGGAGLAANLNGLSGKTEERVEVSLPSPTPSSNPGTSGWRPEVMKNPFSQQGSRANNNTVATNIPATQNLHGTSLLHSPTPHSDITPPPPRQPQTALSQQVWAAAPTFSTSHTTAILTDKQPTSLVPSFPQTFPTPILRNTMGVEVLANYQPAPERNSYSQQHQTQPEPSHLYPSGTSIGKLGLGSNLRGPRLSSASNFQSQADQNNYNASIREHVQPQILSGTWETSDHVNEEFETWSPENSPFRSADRIPGRGLPESRMNSGRNLRPDWSREQNSSAPRDYNRNVDSRRWQDRRR